MPPKSKKMDELGVEPKTSPMLRERATNYATRPTCVVKIKKIITGRVGSRTQDLSHAKGARYQLRHTPW